MSQMQFCVDYNYIEMHSFNSEVHGERLYILDVF